jgi:hypothetical protein
MAGAMAAEAAVAGLEVVVTVAGSVGVVMAVGMEAVVMGEAPEEVKRAVKSAVGMPAEEVVAEMAEGGTVVEETEEEDMEAAQAGLEAGCLVGCLVEETGKAATPRLSTPQTESSDPSQCLPQERSARQS